MKSNNPIFNRSAEFNRPGSAYGAQTYPGSTQRDPSQWGVGTPGGPTDLGAPPETRPMTIDSVVQKSAITLAIVVVVAAATWILTPAINAPNVGLLMAAATVGALGAFGLSMVNSFKKVISPALVIAFAVLEGVALGAISKIFEAMAPGVVVQAVLGTFMAFAGTLAAYKFFNIQVSDKFRKGVMAAMFGMIGLAMMEMLLGAFGSQIGLFGVTGLGMLTAVAGLVLGVFMLILDFDFVEKGAAAGIPERESWRAAFALTVSLVWIYTNLLRILAFLQQE